MVGSYKLVADENRSADRSQHNASLTQVCCVVTSTNGDGEFLVWLCIDGRSPREGSVVTRGVDSHRNTVGRTIDEQEDTLNLIVVSHRNVDGDGHIRCDQSTIERAPDAHLRCVRVVERFDSEGAGDGAEIARRIEGLDDDGERRGIVNYGCDPVANDGSSG